MGLLFVAVVLLAIAGLIAAAEAALIALPRGQVAAMVADGKRGARRLDRIISDLPTHINVATFVRTISESGAAVCVTLVLARYFDSWWQLLLVAVLVLAVFTFILVGVSPRTVGRRQAANIALGTGWLIHGLRRVLGPLAKLLVWFGNVVTPARVYREGPFVTEDQLRDLVDRAGESDVIEDEEREMIQSVFNLGDTLTRSVMVPRTDLVTIDRDTVLHKAMTLFLRSGFSRAPVVGDTDDDVLGIVYLKDVARRVHGDPSVAHAMTVEAIARPAMFVPETKPIDSLMREMQQDARHVAVVVDEYGGTAGLVTIEDIVEEIVGEIDDEYDKNDDDVEDVGGGVRRVSSRQTVEDVGELFDLTITDEDVTSIGGLLQKALGKVPIAGSTATIHGLRIEAEPGVGRRHQITHLLVSLDETAGGKLSRDDSMHNDATEK
ncbi:hemolysin family protein [Saxibacter everestensis]|uniref:Hemolysin family protein n=1 Tax=Saxibacter everestensis TaxID=2909229 RepID=A0ABY8QYD5_9MICO|nr:hemolysin family protein [Brevibacteriaceae bacterium ZFBP1038]